MIITLISITGYYPARRIQSTKAFLFSLKPYASGNSPTKFDVSPINRRQAIRGEKNRGPCWGYDKQEMGFTSQTVKIRPGATFNYNGVSNVDVFYTGLSDFQADDLEVFTISGRKQYFLMLLALLEK